MCASFDVIIFVDKEEADSQLLRNLIFQKYTDLQK